MANKITQKEMFNEIITLAEEAGRDDIVKFAEGRIEMLAKKSASKKATANQQANEVIKKAILNILGENDRMLAGEVLTALVKNEVVSADTNNQKISAILRLMIADGTVEKTVDKKKSYFSAV